MEPQPLGISGHRDAERVLPAAGAPQRDAPARPPAKGETAPQPSHTHEARVPIAVHTSAEISIDSKTHRMTLKVVDTGTGEVLLSWPPRPVAEVVAAHSGLTASINQAV